MLSVHVQGHDLRFSLADLRSYLMTKLADTACLLLHVLARVRQQRKVVGEVIFMVLFMCRALRKKKKKKKKPMMFMHSTLTLHQIKN